MNAVFLDTVELLALWDVADQWHAQAEELASQQCSVRPHFQWIPR